jgi:hypothetical protein
MGINDSSMYSPMWWCAGLVSFFFPGKWWRASRFVTSRIARKHQRMERKKTNERKIQKRGGEWEEVEELCVCDAWRPVMRTENVIKKWARPSSFFFFFFFYVYKTQLSRSDYMCVSFVCTHIQVLSGERYSSPWHYHSRTRTHTHTQETRKDVQTKEKRVGNLNRPSCGKKNTWSINKFFFFFFLFFFSFLCFRLAPCVTINLRGG